MKAMFSHIEAKITTVPNLKDNRMWFGALHHSSKKVNDKWDDGPAWWLSVTVWGDLSKSLQLDKGDVVKITNANFEYQERNGKPTFCLNLGDKTNGFIEVIRKSGKYREGTPQSGQQRQQAPQTQPTAMPTDPNCPF